MNFFFLKTFIDTAKTGSVKAAAMRNYVTQPAVTQHIHLLEEKLECKLFERQNKKMTLTPAGKLFLNTAENILKTFEDSKRGLRELNQKISGTLRLGTIYSIGLYQLQPLVKTFLQKYPTLDIHLEYQPFDKIYERVQNQDIDFGFVAYPKKKAGVIITVFHEENLVVCQSPSRRLIKKMGVSLSELNGIKLVAFSSGTPTHDAIENFLREKNIQPVIVNEYDNIETLKSAVQLGLGISIVPRDALTHELKNHSLEIVPVQGLTLTRPLGVLYPKGKTLSKLSQAFYETAIKNSR